MPRSTQRDILPSAIKTRNLGNIVRVNDSVGGTAALANGGSVIFSITVTNDFNAPLIGETEWSVWEDTMSESQLLPDGANVLASDYQIIGPWNEWTDFEFSGGDPDVAVPPFALISRIFIRNISAGNVTLIARARNRNITNINQNTVT